MLSNRAIETLRATTVLTVAATLCSACVQDRPTAPNPAWQLMGPRTAEGEFIGNLYVNGVKSTEGYDVALVPVTPATWARLRQPHSTTMWGNPSKPRMWEWYDPKDGGGCGDLIPYLQGDSTARDPEGHWSDPDSPPGDTTVKEKHCIRPGVYRFTVAGKSFLVDYLGVEADSEGARVPVWNETAGIYEVIEARTPGDTHNVWVDLTVNVDVGTTSYGEQRTLSVENAGRHPDTTVFHNQENPSGRRRDWFRFSVAGSASDWPGQDGKALARLYWDFGRDISVATNYYDPFSAVGRIIRLHNFFDHVESTRDVSVALEMMRPDEEPGDTVNVTQRSVHIEANARPNASFSVSCQQLPCTFADSSSDTAAVTVTVNQNAPTCLLKRG